MNQPLEITIWSDFACPYCYIGKAHLDEALKEFEHSDDVKIRFRAFELDPSEGKECTTTTQQRIEKKYRKTPQGALDMIDGIEELGRRAGLTMNYHTVRYTNTFDAHRLNALAQDRGLGQQMSNALFDAYFTKNLELSDPEVLRMLAQEVGLDAAEVSQLLADDSYAKQCRLDEQAAHEAGIRGVPAFAFDSSTIMAGAQPAQTLLRALRETWDKQQVNQEEEVPFCGPTECFIPGAKS